MIVATIIWIVLVALVCAFMYGANHTTVETHNCASETEPTPNNEQPCQ